MQIERTPREAIEDFCFNSSGVNLIALQGFVSPDNLPMFYLALFPDNKFVVQANSDLPVCSPVLINLYETIFRLTIPDYLKDQPEFRDRPEMRRLNEIVSRNLGNPIVVFDLGLNRFTQEDYTLLYVLSGISPQTALQETQDALRSALPGY